LEEPATSTRQVDIYDAAGLLLATVSAQDAGN
jgi:hypothetical protein